MKTGEEREEKIWVWEGKEHSQEGEKVTESERERRLVTLSPRDFETEILPVREDSAQAN
jgi:hypothetical protein